MKDKIFQISILVASSTLMAPLESRVKSAQLGCTILQISYFHFLELPSTLNSTNLLRSLYVFKNKYNFIVYNKSGNELKHNKENLIQKYLPNVGHESDTYLNHIIDNYDNLSEYTIFIQDDTNNHIPDHNKFISF